MITAEAIEQAHAMNLRKFADSWCQNWEANWPRVARLPGITEWKDRFENIPAIVCGAGPSLERALPTLRYYQNHYMIIAVDRAYELLRVFGITPDVTVSIDAQSQTAEYFAYYHDGDIVALIPWCDPAVIEGIGAQNVVPFIEAIPTHPFWQDVRREYFRGCDCHWGALAAGGTVGTSAAALTTGMGCNPILFLGYDLCEGETETHTDGKPIFKTKPALMVEKEWIENMVSKLPQKHFINATGRGILTGNCEIIEPEIAIPHCRGLAINHKYHLRKYLETRAKNKLFQAFTTMLAQVEHKTR